MRRFAVHLRFARRRCALAFDRCRTQRRTCVSQGTVAQAMALRVKNDASPEDAARVLRGHMACIDSITLTMPLDVVISRYNAMLVDLLQKTQRPTVRLLSSAATIAFGADRSEAKMFAQLVCEAVAFARRRGRSATTGKKVGNHILDVYKAMARSHPPKSKHGRILKRQASEQTQSTPRRRLRAKSAGGVYESTLESAPMDSRAASSTQMPYHDLPTNRDEILALYGVKEAKSLSQLKKEPVCIDDDSEPELIPYNDATAEGEPYKEFVEPGAMKFVRLYTDGRRLEAKLREGPNGFVIGNIEGQDRETEMPNLEWRRWVSSSMKRPAAALAPLKGGAHALRKARHCEDDGARAREERKLAEEEEESEEKREGVEEGKGKEEEEADEEGKKGRRRLMKKQSVKTPDGEGEGEEEAICKTFMKEWYKATGKYGIRERGGRRCQAFTLGGAEKEVLGRVADEAIVRLSRGVAAEEVRAWANSTIAKAS